VAEEVGGSSVAAAADAIAINSRSVFAFVEAAIRIVSIFSVRSPAGSLDLSNRLLRCRTGREVSSGE